MALCKIFSCNVGCELSKSQTQSVIGPIFLSVSIAAMGDVGISYLTHLVNVKIKPLGGRAP